MAFRYLKHRLLMMFSVRYHMRYLAENHVQQNFDQPEGKNHG